MLLKVLTDFNHARFALLSSHCPPLVKNHTVEAPLFILTEGK